MTEANHWESTFEVEVSSVSREIGLAAACAGNPRDVRRIGRWVWHGENMFDGTTAERSYWVFEPEAGVNLTGEDVLAIRHLMPRESPIKTVGALELDETTVSEKSAPRS